MTPIMRYLPLLHALSTSSPFNAGHETGFKSFRLTIMGNLPRTGMPGPLGSWAEYEWLARRIPAHGLHRRRQPVVVGHPALPRLPDGGDADLRHLHPHRRSGEHRGPLCVPRPLARAPGPGRRAADRAADRAHRGGPLDGPTLPGVFAFLGNRASGGGRADIYDQTAELIERLAPDARALGCETEIRRALTIVRDGTGADRQLDLYRLRRLEGDTREEALRQVVDMVVAETREGIGDVSG